MSDPTSTTARRCRESASQQEARNSNSRLYCFHGSPVSVSARQEVARREPLSNVPQHCARSDYLRNQTLFTMCSWAADRMCCRLRQQLKRSSTSLQLSSTPLKTSLPSSEKRPTHRVSSLGRSLSGVEGGQILIRRLTTVANLVKGKLRLLT